MSNIQNITEQFKGLSVEELLAIIAAATAEAKKSAKAVSKAPKEAKEKKGSMPKGSVPPQLRKPRAWVDFTLAHANTNGWESFEVKGQSEPMAASVLVDGKHVFEATGKPMNNKQAMSLSKVRWDRKEGKGTRKDLYDEFEASYVEAEVEVVAPKEVVAAPEVVSAEPEVKAEAPKKEKKAAPPKKTEEEKKAEKEAAALKKAAEKEAEKLRKEAEKLAEKEAAAAKKAAEKAEKPKKVVKKAASPKAEEVPPFEHEDDGFAHPWDFKGKKFLRDFNGNMWFRTEDGESAGWAGKFDPVTNTIDDSAEEPEYEDEE
jgi:hypothetical protein